MHPLNLVDVTKYEHQNEHFEFDQVLFAHPHILMADISPRTVTEFLDEAAETYDKLLGNIGLIGGFHKKIALLGNQSSSEFDVLSKELQTAEGTIDARVAATEGTTVVPPVLMQLGVNKLLGKVAYLQPVAA